MTLSRGLVCVDDGLWVGDAREMVRLEKRIVFDFWENVAAGATAFFWERRDDAE